MTLAFQNAAAADLDVIRAMLSADDLPADDIHEHIGELIVAKWEGETIGGVAIESAGHAALLRSLCVAPRHRGQTVGTRLLTAVEARAASLGVCEVYLLTTSAAAFFERHGFSRISRADAPAKIRSTAQFLSLCPSTAVCMRKTLPTFSNERTRSP